ncbi:hypothetical protein J4G78_16960 [Parasphingorhabdus cellanae]|uniref:DmpG-like communication domain-containing protein n=1 Tax=Parasphingorhabdus cellanae TaxID=2806553 RepID=A0ABX7T9X0_9SPHN|nr:hypothetical protein J4G78_16960 [Parasphingorhabdus cellanae]
MDTRPILIEVRKRGIVGGQEDMILDVALDIVVAKEAKKTVTLRRLNSKS